LDNIIEYFSQLPAAERRKRENSQVKGEVKGAKGKKEEEEVKVDL
jgi:hypothetical protein